MPPRKKPATVTFDDASEEDSNSNELSQPRYSTIVDDDYLATPAPAPKKRRAYSRRKSQRARDNVDDLIDETNKLARRTKNRISGAVKRYMPERCYCDQDDMYKFAYYVGLGTCLLVTGYAVFKLATTN